MPIQTNPRSHAPSRSGQWTSEQLKLAFHLYCQLPFGKLHSRNPKIVELAQLIGRTPSAVAMKLVNFASLDPAITASGRTGLTGASKLDREVWGQFNSNWEALALECERLRQRLLAEHGMQEEEIQVEDACDDALNDFSGETRAVLVQQRLKQRFFRRAVLSSYRGRCCISGVSEPRLLVASHIIPWRANVAHRLNPRNGLCLSSIHDRAFDAGLFTLSDDLNIMLSTPLRRSGDEFLQRVFSAVEGDTIEAPERFLPDREFLDHHRRHVFVDANPAQYARL